jgi:hypothetical protein
LIHTYTSWQARPTKIENLCRVGDAAFPITGQELESTTALQQALKRANIQIQPVYLGKYMKMNVLERVLEPDDTAYNC